MPAWDDLLKRKAIDFWSRRRVVFSETSASLLVGKRGSILGNLISFDMSKLISRITISVSPQDEVECALSVNTVFQQITDYNRAWWDLELETFESFLLRNDELEERWKAFGVKYNRASWAWALSLGRKGNKMPPEERP